MERDTHRLCIGHLRLTEPPWTIDSQGYLADTQNRQARRPDGAGTGKRQERAISLNKQRQGQFTEQTQTSQFTEAGTERQQADTSAQ